MHKRISLHGDSLFSSFSTFSSRSNSGSYDIQESIVTDFRRSDFLASVVARLEVAQKRVSSHWNAEAAHLHRPGRKYSRVSFSKTSGRRHSLSGCSDNGLVSSNFGTQSNNSGGCRSSGNGVLSNTDATFAVKEVHLNSDNSTILSRRQAQAEMTSVSNVGGEIEKAPVPLREDEIALQLPANDSNNLRASGKVHEIAKAAYIDNICLNFSSEICKAPDLDFDSSINPGFFGICQAEDYDSESNASYIDKEGDLLRFSVEDGCLTMYVNNEKSAGCNDKTGLVEELTYTPGQPADVRTQSGWGSSDMPWSVVRKLKRLADRVGVPNNLPDVPLVPSSALVNSHKRDTTASGGSSFLEKMSTKKSAVSFPLKVRDSRFSRHSSDASSKGPSSKEYKAWKNRRMGSGVFADIDDLKAGVRQALIRGNSGRDLLKEEGICQTIVRSSWFEWITFMAVPLNALWVALDTDLNTAKSQEDNSGMLFVIIDALFALFFFIEWMLRLCAFEDMREGLKEKWFMLDTMITILLVFDMAIAVATHAVGFLGNTSLLKILRTLRLVRMARISRMMRSMPELVVLLKGIGAAAKSVFFTLCLLGILVFVFSVGFRQLTDGSPIGKKYFKNVPAGMYSLVLYATLPDMADMVDNVSAEHAILGAVLLFFILGASLTVMNMLVGVLVEVVSVVSSIEKEEKKVWGVKAKLMGLLDKLGWEKIDELVITREKFTELIQMQEAARAIEEVGVDPVALIENVEIIFTDSSLTGFSFPELIELLLQLRGSNMCTVKDIIDLRKFMFQEQARTEKLLNSHTDLLKKVAGSDQVRPRHFSDRSSYNDHDRSRAARATRVFGNVFTRETTAGSPVSRRKLTATPKSLRQSRTWHPR